jgi:hypothetical protein
VHSQPIAVEIPAEAAQLRWPGALHIGDPLIKLGPTSLADQEHESLCQSPARGQLVASAQIGEHDTVRIIEFRAAAQEQPAQILRTRQDAAHGWWRLRLTPILDESSNRSLAATITECADLIMQESSDLATFLPTTDQVRSESIESTWSQTGGAAKSAAELTLTNLRTVVRLRWSCSAIEVIVKPLVRSVDLRVTMLVPTLDPTRSHWNGWRCSLFCVRQLIGRALLVQLCQHPYGHALERVSEVVDDMPRIGDLHCIGCHTRRRTGVHAISITADDFHTRVVTQPIGQRVGRRILEQVDHLM